MSKTIGQRIRELREQKGLTQRQLGERVGCAQTTVAGWEALSFRSPGKRFIEKVGQVLGVTVDYLLSQKEVETPRIPYYGEIKSDIFKWMNEAIQSTIDVAQNEYKPGRFAVRLSDSYMEPLIFKDDYCIFEKKSPKDRDIVIAKFPEDETATLRILRQAKSEIVLIVPNSYDPRPVLVYHNYQKKEEYFLIKRKPRKTMIVEGVLVGTKKIWG